MTKHEEAEVLKVYHKWLYAYLNGDVKTYDSYFDDAFHFIGSTNNEEFLNRENTTNFFKATAAQLAGKSQLRNETKIVEQFGELVFITHLFDAWFMNGTDWSFYGRFRFTNMLQKKEAGWRFIYQHYSTPDTKAQEGETIGFDQVSKENLQLREAIQRRTVELETKNRELKIEGALERIRAQAVAMKTSSDLLDIVVTMRNEFIKLGHEAHYFWHMMWLPDTYEKAMTSGDGSKIGFVMKLPRHIHGDIPLLANWEKSKTPTVVYPMRTEEAIVYVDKMVALGDFQNIDPQAPSNDDIRHIGGLTFVMARTSHGEIGFSLPGVVKNPPQASLILLKQFAGAFDLAHRRFLDLQIAEKQAREVEIELALEKVRSRTMAMQKSDELAEASQVLDQQVRALGVETWGCAFHIYADNDEGDFEWFSGPNGLLPFYKTPREEFFLKFYQRGQQGEKFHVEEFKGEDCKAHYDFLKAIPVAGDALKALEDSGVPLPTYQIDHIAFFNHGYVMFITYEPVPEAHDIFQRFAKVFEQTYTRFLDLQKAEAQAREAQIEAALEKVRSRTMAMQKSEELPLAANNLFLQVQELGIPAWSTGYCIWQDEKQNASCNMSSEGEIQKGFILPSIGEGYDFYTPQENGEHFHVKELGGEALVKHYEFMKQLPNMGEILNELINAGLELPTFQIFHIVYFKFGYVMFITYEEVPEAHDIFKRFGQVFEQTYTRFLDLERAEAQAREAQIEAALERVRSKTMAMHSSEDVDITVLTLFEEVSKLGLNKSIRCGIGILQDKEYMETWSATYTQNGEVDLKVGVLDMVLHPLLIEIKKTWKKGGKYLTYELEGRQVKEYYTVLNNAPGYPFQVDLTKLPSRTYHNSFYFTSGVLFAFTDQPISNETANVLNRFSGVFDQTYTRFLDLQKAEAQALLAEENLNKLKIEKQRAEEALSELQQTQKQLIQSEKMASLGELTAGIAHEIQNPLNFVNNFSEVSNELIDEIQEERAKHIEQRDEDLVDEILGDIKQNLEKINHHGKRADNIVKGMLQHSRSSTGQKEPTDINALADEYLRLAYHGLRAKDKSFNAELKTDFDETIGMVNVIPQDIGRVILNLITNAFYACTERGRSASKEEHFKPAVSVSTKKTGDYLEIKVTDNGNGIPKEVVDKIFQPFFTTKPTGQGTGLGLSMSYEIITKGHGGELKMETKEGKGTTFYIILRVTN